MAAHTIVSIVGYKRRLHMADVAVITPSPTHREYMLVDGTLQRLARSLTPVVVEAYPVSLPTAHEAFAEALKRHPVWILLRDVIYPAWVMATAIQVQGAYGGYRIFVVRGHPRFQLMELPF